MKILHLNLKKEWFDKIKSGEKIHEFREYKEYWTKRLCDKNTFKKYDVIEFKNGYQKNAPTIIAEFKSTELKNDIETPLGFGNFYVINIGNILETFDNK